MCSLNFMAVRTLDYEIPCVQSSRWPLILEKKILLSVRNRENLSFSGAWLCMVTFFLLRLWDVLCPKLKSFRKSPEALSLSCENVHYKFYGNRPDKSLNFVEKLWTDDDATIKVGEAGVGCHRSQLYLSFGHHEYPKQILWNLDFWLRQIVQNKCQNKMLVGGLRRVFDLSMALFKTLGDHLNYIESSSGDYEY